MVDRQILTAIFSSRESLLEMLISANTGRRLARFSGLGALFTGPAVAEEHPLDMIEQGYRLATVDRTRTRNPRRPPLVGNPRISAADRVFRRDSGRIVAFPEVGGLHHRYERLAA